MPEPENAAAFIRAQREHDVEQSSLVTSPLFRAELERRGRDTEWPLLGLWIEAAPLLDYSYLGGVRDDHGFTHTLYSARLRHASGSDTPTSLWRIDLDPKGQVIWGELARVFDNPRVELIPGPRATSPADERRSTAFALRSAAGDAYVALHPDPENPDRIAFAQQATSGELGPSYWSFGQPTPTRDAEGHPVAPRPFDLTRLTAADVLILHAYLGILD